MFRAAKIARASLVHSETPEQGRRIRSDAGRLREHSVHLEHLLGFLPEQNLINLCWQIQGQAVILLLLRVCERQQGCAGLHVTHNPSLHEICKREHSIELRILKEAYLCALLLS